MDLHRASWVQKLYILNFFSFRVHLGPDALNMVCSKPGKHLPSLFK